MTWPRALTDVEPIAGSLKSVPEDFIVDEIPLYPFSGEGEHALVQIEKRGLSTGLVVRQLASILNISRRDIGIAGLKDSRAVTRQWISLLGVPSQTAETLDLKNVRIVQVTRHRNKLRRGHLAGNRFAIRVRATSTRAIDKLREGLNQLVAYGVPNYFGPQRFGIAGENWRIGHAILANDPPRVLRDLLGGDLSLYHGRIREARAAFEAGDFPKAMRALAGVIFLERRMLKSLIRGMPAKRIVRTMDHTSREFFVCALQSYLFNYVCGVRVTRGDYGRVLTGDLAWLHANGAVFAVEDGNVEQPRAEVFEISPTGPLVGRRMTQPAGEAAAIETEQRDALNIPSEALAHPELRSLGGRRPLRFRPSEATIEAGEDSRGPYFELRFILPSGCYATALLRELFDEKSSADVDDDE